MINKTVATAAEAVAKIHDGATVMIGGFGTAGQPAELIDALIEHGATDLTIVNNNAGNGDIGLAALIKAKRVKKLFVRFRGNRIRMNLTSFTMLAKSSWSWCRRATWRAVFRPQVPA